MTDEVRPNTPQDVFITIRCSADNLDAAIKGITCTRFQLTKTQSRSDVIYGILLSDSNAPHPVGESHV